MSSVSPSLDALAGRVGRFPFRTLNMTAGSALHVSNGISPVKTCSWDTLAASKLFLCVATTGWFRRTSMVTIAKA